MCNLTHIIINKMDAENRNNIPVMIPSRIRVSRCCSFCHQPGHNVSRCNSDILLEFEVICANQVRNITQQEFRIWITQNYINQHLLLKSFAIRKCKSNSRLPTAIYIEHIISYIFRNYRYDISTDDNFEEDILNILINLRNNSERNHREEPSIEDIQGINQTILREYMLELFNNYMTNVRSHYSENRKLNIFSTVENDENSGNCECNICWEEKEVKNFVKLGCNHEFCKDCLIKSLKADLREKPCCALCRTEVKTLRSRTELVHSELLNLVA
jgi:hypothetical protein